jgi:hypothetical protein
VADTLKDLITNGAFAAAPVVDDDYSLEELVDAGLSDKEAKKRTRQERSRIPQGNQDEYLREADALLKKSQEFQSIGSFAEQERYPSPFGIERSARDEIDEGGDRSRQGWEQQRGGNVIVDRGKGKERLWRERSVLYSDPKFAKNKQPDFPNLKAEDIAITPQGSGMGGPAGLATQLADKVARGELDPNALVPGSSTRTIGALIHDMAMEADPQLRAEADYAAGREVARQDVEGLASDEIERRTKSQLTAEFGNQGLDNFRGSTDPTKKPPAWKRDSIAPGANPRTDQVAREQAILASLTGPVYNPEIVARNQREAATEAGRFQLDTQAINNLENIENIQGLGLASKKFNRGVPMEQFNVVPGVDPNTFTDAIEMVGPDGQTVGYSDNTDKWVADVNLASPESANNAPTSRTATWMEGNLPGFGREGGTSFGARSVNPGDELSMLNQRLGQFGSVKGIRGIDDLEQAIRAVTVDAAFRGATMWNFDQATGKKVAVRDPGLDEVLYGLDYTADEKTRLAAALQSVEAARLSPVNSLQKALYAEGIPSESKSRVGRGFEKDVQLERITNERVGRDNKKTGEKRISVRKGLRELNASPEEVFANRDPNTVYATAEDGSRVLLPEAQQDLIDARAGLGVAQRPYQAAPQGQKPERARFLGKGIYKMSDAERIEKFGGSGGEAANEVLRRAIEDKQLRVESAKAQDPIAAQFRERDAEFNASGQNRLEADNRREVNEAFERMGVSLEGKGQMLLGGQIVPDSRTKDIPNRNVVPQGPLQKGMTVEERKLQNIKIKIEKQTRERGKATSAQVNPQTESAPLEQRNGWMGGGGNGRIENPWASSTPEPEGERRINSGATQGPRTPGIRQKIMNSIKRSPSNFRSASRAKRYGAIAGGVAMGGLGIDGLIGDERDNRQEAQY